MSQACPTCHLEFDDSVVACPRHGALVPAGQEGDPIIGRIIGERYQVTAILGKGAMGVVYRARQLSDGNEIAVKVLHAHLASDQESLKRFHAEARAASSLMHANIVRIYDVGVLPTGAPYIAMELVNGKTLGEFLKDRQFLEPKQALPIIRQVCEALAEAHSHGVLHRDIKPANIMLLSRYGIDNFVVVLDFSIAKVVHKVSDADSTTAGMILGSPVYMSPERFRGQGGDFRSEIYSLGIILFQMLTGRPPFKSTDLYALMNDHVKTVPPSIKAVRPEADVSANLEAIIARTLAKQPEERQENMKQLLAQISDEFYEVQTPARKQPMVSLVAEEFDTTGSGSRILATAQALVPWPVAPRAGARVSGEVPAASTFDVNPGGLPALEATGYDKRKNEQKLNAELNASGKWDRSLIVKCDRQRPLIRHKDSSDRQLLKVGVSATVFAAAILVVCVSLLHRPNENELSIKALVSKGDLRNATNMVQEWHNNGVPKEGQEQFGRACLEIAKAYQKKKDLKTAAMLYAMVPEKTQSFAEARRGRDQCTNASQGE